MCVCVCVCVCSVCMRVCVHVYACVWYARFACVCVHLYSVRVCGIQGMREHVYGCGYKNCLMYSICAVPQLVPHCGAITRVLSLFLN